MNDSKANPSKRQNIEYFWIVFSAFALKCWECESKRHPVCSVSWDSSLISEQIKSNLYKECPGEVCFKEVLNNGNGKWQSLCTNCFWIKCDFKEQQKAFNSFVDTKNFWMRIFVYFFHLVKGVIEAKRGCARNENIENSDCRSFEVTLHNQGYPNAKAECFTCDSDGCNGAAQYGPIALFIALPVAIAKFFLF